MLINQIETPTSRKLAAWQRARRLLCVRLDTLGDILMTTPAFRALRESAPDRSITLLTSSQGRVVAPFIPEIDDCIAYDCPWMKATRQASDSSRDFEMISALRERRFDAAVIFTVYSQNPFASALLCHLAGIPLRLAHCRENPYHLLTDWVPEREPQTLCRHEVRRQLDLVATVGARTADETLSFLVNERDRKKVEEVLRTSLLDRTRPWLLVHPGASASSRRYPPESFSRVADLITAHLGYQVLFTGTVGEKDLIDFIQAGMAESSTSLAGLFSLGELGALLELSPLLISNNTGPVHIAAAVGTPVVDLYALTNPQHTPWGIEHRVLFHDVPCKYCYKSICPEGHHNCLRLVSPDSVFAAVSELLAASLPQQRTENGLNATA